MRGWLPALATLVVSACGGHAEPPREEQVGAAASSALPGSERDAANEAPGGAPGPVAPTGAPVEIEEGPRPPAPLECPWERRAAMPIGSAGMAAAVHGGSLYVFGGRILDEHTYAPGPPDGASEGRWSVVQAYDPILDTWTRKQPMPIEVTELTAASVGDAIYVFAGYGLEGFANQVYRYEPATDGWLEVARLPVHRSRFTSAVVGGKVYLIGGHGQLDDGPQTDGEWFSKSGLLIFDPATNTWAEGAAAPGPIKGGATCALGDRIFAFDGHVSGATYVYDTTSDTWSEGAPAPEARNEMSCAARSDRLLLLGGRVSIGHEVDETPAEPFTSGGTIESSRLIQEYDPATDTWLPYGRMPRAREQFAALPLGTAVYVIGGSESHTLEGPQGTFVLDEVTVMLDLFCEVR